MGLDKPGRVRNSGITATMELFDAREMADLHRALVSLISELDSREVVRQVVEGAIGILGGDFAYLFLKDRDGTLSLASQRNVKKHTHRDLNAEKVATQRSAKLVLTGDDLKQSLAGHDPLPSSLVYAPLKTQREIEGVICVGSYEKHFTVKHLKALSLLAQPAGLVLERARLYEESTSLSGQLRTLTEVQKILSAMSLDKAFSAFGMALSETINFDLILFFTYEPGSQEYVVSYAWSPQGATCHGWVGRRVAAGRSLHSRALSARSKTLIDDLQSMTEGLERAWLLGAGMVSGLVLPLMSYETAVGVFSLWSRSKGSFSSGESDFIQSLGQHLALAVKNQRLFTQLEQAKTEWESTFDAMIDAVWITDASQRVQRFNRAFRQAVGKENLEILGASAPSLLATDPYELSFRPGEESRQGRFRREVSRSRLGKAIEVVATRIPHDEGGRVVYVARDVSEAREMNARLQEANRLAGLGHLASAMAHEINNPLSYIAANLHRIQDKAEKNQLYEGSSERLTSFVRELPELASESLDGVSRVKRIVEMLQVYSRREKGETAFALNELVDFCLTLVWASMRRRAQVEKNYGALPRYFGDQHLLSQVLVNIFVSAARSLDPAKVETNQIKITTRYEQDTWKVTVEAFRDGEKVPIDREGNFEPFTQEEQSPFSSGFWIKPDFELVVEMGGNVLFAGENEVRTSVTLVLQRKRKNILPSIGRVETLPGVAALQGRVLIIDDEPYVRRALRRVLSNSHEVEVARNGSQALEIIEKSPESFDVILCDVVMPGMSGLDFINVVSQRWPSLRDHVVFVTGGVFSAEAGTLLQEGPNPVLRKPVQPKVLVSTVEQVLARKYRGR